MAIIKTEAYFNSTDGKNLCHTLIWRDDDTDPLGIFQIAHGVTDHIDRYDRFARFLAENGFVVCGNDHLGHGKTAPSIDKLGDFGAPDSDIRMVDDMHMLHNIMSKKYPNIPYFLLGHSMGSFLSRIYAANFGDELTGLILCGTAQIGGKLSALQDYVYPLGEMIGGDKYSSLGSDIIGKITAKYYHETDDNAWLSQSVTNREKADDDIYFDFPITNDSSMIVAKLLLKCSSDECIAAMPPLLPVFLISGGQDPIGFFGRGVVSLCEKLEMSCVDVEMKLYPGLRHEILNEDEYENVYNDILAWAYDKLQGGKQ